MYYLPVLDQSPENFIWMILLGDFYLKVRKKNKMMNS
jgi:hypothetical protein